MKLIRKQSNDENNQSSGVGNSINRRAFLKRSGIAMGTGAASTLLTPGRMKKAHAASQVATGDITVKKSVCTHCSVGCGVVAEVQNGVWTGQEPDFDSMGT